jgi:hypothetical protein
MIYLDRKSINDLGHEEYVEIYKGVFGKWDETGNCPAEVYIGYDSVSRETFLGFLAGYPTGPGSWYLQRGGFLRGEQGKFRNLSVYREALKELHKYWPCVRTHVFNDDLPALKIDLNAGFKIIGTRSLNGLIEIELIHYLEDGNGQ